MTDSGRKLPGGGARRRWVSLLAVCLAVWALSAWGVVPGEVARAGAACPDAIRVGLVFPLSGREARPGTYQLEGVQLSVKLVNAEGGVMVRACGRRLPLQTVVYDDQSDQARSAQLAERAMSADNVVAVIGGYSTVLGQAQSVMPDRYQVPWITPGAAASAIFNQGYQWTFGLLSPVDNLGYTTTQFLNSLVEQGKLRRGLRIAMVVENTDHGVDYVNGINRWLEANPGVFEVVFNERFQLGSPDFTGILQRVRAARADIFLSDAHLEDYITMHRQYTQLGLRHLMVSYGARGPEAPARQALGAAADYIFAGVWWSRDLPYPQVQRFVQQYQQEYGRLPDSWYAATAFDSVRVLVRAIEQAGRLDRTAIRDALRQVRLTDSLLPGQVVEFPPHGQVQAPFVIVQNKPGGRVDIVYPADAATGEVVVGRP